MADGFRVTVDDHQNEGFRAQTAHYKESWEAARRLNMTALETIGGLRAELAGMYGDDAPTRTDLMEQNALLLGQLRQRSREYGRASATIGQLRAEVARRRGSALMVKALERNNAAISATNKEIAAERDLALWLHAEAVHKLSLPCGSCHPCTHWAEETWRRADRTPPDVYQYDELRWLHAEAVWQRDNAKADLFKAHVWIGNEELRKIGVEQPVTEATEPWCDEHGHPALKCSYCLQGAADYEITEECKGTADVLHSAGEIESQPEPIDTSGLKYIRDYYKVPARVDVRVLLQGWAGVIVGNSGPHLLVHRDGDEVPVAAHPTWEIQYLTAENQPHPSEAPVLASLPESPWRSDESDTYAGGPAVCTSLYGGYRCELGVGHSGDHRRYVGPYKWEFWKDAASPATPTEPRVWRQGDPEPGPDVYGVRTSTGVVLTRWLGAGGVWWMHESGQLYPWHRVWDLSDFVVEVVEDQTGGEP